MTLRQLFSEIADAIRRKTGKEESIKAENFSEEIGKIPTVDDVEEKTVKSTNVEQIVAPTEGKLINKINVEPIELEEVNVTPTTSTQTITPASDKDGISQVNVEAVTSDIDSNIVSENIKKDVRNIRNYWEL